MGGIGLSHLVYCAFRAGLVTEVAQLFKLFAQFRIHIDLARLEPLLVGDVQGPSSLGTGCQGFAQVHATHSFGDGEVVAQVRRLPWILENVKETDPVA